MDTSLQSLDQAVLHALEGIEGIAAVAIFGSHARGQPHSESDLDIAILPRPEMPMRHRLQGRIAAALADLVPGGRVDVVFLDEAPELLRHEVFAKGRVVILRDAPRWKELRRRTMAEHGDREHFRALLREAQRLRLLGSPGDG
jgi:predicted nucleotidyltransferase